MAEVWSVRHPVLAVDGIMTVFHALLLYPAAVALWFGSLLGLRCDGFCGTSFSEWVMNLASSLDMEQMGLVVTIAATIWEQRNEVVHGKHIPFPQVLIARNISRLAEYLEAQITRDQTRVRLRGMDTKWLKPPFSAFKLNSDASIKGNGFIEIGFVIRNHRGKVVGAGLDRAIGNTEIDCVEAIALQKAMEFARSLGCRKLVVESDSRNVISKILSPKPDLSYFNLLLEECQNLKDKSEVCHFSHVRRQRNSVAHGLATLAQNSNLNFPTYWIEDIHLSIIPLVVKDSID